MHPTAIARLETGQRDPRLATIAKIARALDVPASQLVRGI
jgi:transcriptional regulator with XRE-family HTH domain